MSHRWPAAWALLLAVGACSKQPAPQQQQATQLAGPAKGTPAWKIANAMSAAPEQVAAGATIMDLPATPDGQMTQLRAGTNGWTCAPDDPATPGNDPVCGDSVSFAWFGQMMQHRPPRIRTVALAYMLQGATDASNTDPFKTKPDSGQPWVVTGPHVMIFVPDPRALQGLPTDWRSGGPYVMYAGTPYAHLMAPVAAAKPGGMSGM
jgi:hypothetical protein